jgi:hypothetical protein
MSVTKTFTITTRHQDLMVRFEMLLTQMQYNSRIGHSAYFGMFVDGDGWDQIEVKELETSDYPQVKTSPRGDLEHPVSTSDPPRYGRKNFRPT